MSGTQIDAAITRPTAAVLARPQLHRRASRPASMNINPNEKQIPRNTSTLLSFDAVTSPRHTKRRDVDALS